MNVSTFVKRLNFYSFLLLCFVSPIHFRLQIYALDFWILTYVIEKLVLWKKPTRLFTRDKTAFYLVLILFSLSLFSLLYSQNIEGGINILERRLALIFIPLAAILGLNEYYSLHDCFRSVILGVLVSIIIMILWSIIDIVQFEHVRTLYNLSFREFIYEQASRFNHRYYWGIYVLLAGLGLIYIRQTEAWKSIRDTHVNILFGILILFFLIAMQSRMIIILVGLLILVQIKLPKQKNKQILILFVAAVILVVLILTLVPRFVHLLDTDSLAFGKLQFAEPRIYVWSSAWEIIRSNWIFGIGIGDVLDGLIEKYRASEFAWGVERKFDAHNQFLQFWLESGILGAGIFFTSILAIFFARNGRFSRLRISFAVLLFFGALTESILNRFSGVVWYSMILVFTYLKDFQEPPSLRTRNIGINRLYFSAKLIGLLLVITGLIILLFMRQKFDPKSPVTYIPYDNYEQVSFERLNLDAVPEGTSGVKFYAEDLVQNDQGVVRLDIAIQNHTIQTGDSLMSSIYCFQSEDFKGKVILLIGSNNYGYVSDYYAATNSNEWQLLSKKRINHTSYKIRENSIITVIPDSISEPRGYVIFAFPEFEDYQ